MRVHAIRFALPLLAAGLLGAAALPAQAQFAPPAPYERNLYLGLFGGLTGGGDELVAVRFNDGTRESIRAGGLVHLGIGFVWQPPQVPVSLQSTVGWHSASIFADNGDVRFTRVPIELLGYMHPAPNWRFGGGVRWVTSPELKSDLPGANDTIRFKDTTGMVLEGGYRFANRFWVNLRYTDEDYEVQSVNGFAVVPTGKTSGRSVGINVVLML